MDNKFISKEITQTLLKTYICLRETQITDRGRKAHAHSILQHNVAKEDPSQVEVQRPTSRPRLNQSRIYGLALKDSFTVLLPPK